MPFSESRPCTYPNSGGVDDTTSPPPEPEERLSFGTIYRRHSKRVRALVRRFGVPERDVDDVTQNVFLAVHRALPRFDWSRRLNRWLNAITYRTARAHVMLKRNRQEKLSETAVFDPPDPASQGREGGDERRRDARDELDAILQSLSEEDRELILLCDLEELHLRDAAELLDLPISTVKPRLQRARRRFEEALHRRRVVEARRLGGAHLLPLFLLDSAALLEAGRALPRVSLAAQARGWGRLVRATATSRTARALASLVGLSPAKLVGLGSLATLVGALGGGAVVYTALHRAADSTAAQSRRETRAFNVAEPPDSLSVIPGAVAPPTLLVTPTAAPSGLGSAARPEFDRAAAERAEMALLDNARSALRSHHPETALFALDRHAREFPQGAYREERESLRREARRMLTTLTASPDP